MHLLPPKGHRARRLALALLILGPFAFGALALALGQDANWDLRNYHWYNAYALLNGRYGIDLLPAQTPTFYNPALDVPFYLLATHVPARLAGFVLGFVQGLNFVLLFMLAHVGLVIPNPRHKVIVCAVLAALGMLGGGGLAMLGCTFYDNVTSLGFFVSAFLVVRHSSKLQRLPPARAGMRAFLFALPMGLMVGLKLPCVIFAVGLCGALLSISAAWPRRVLLAFMFGVGILIGVAVTMGPWAWHLQANFGNPLFPYFNDIFHSPLAPPTSARDTQFIPHELGNILLFPFMFAHNSLRVGEIVWRDWRLPILYALLPLAVILRLVFGRSRTSEAASAPFATHYLLWTAVISYAVWLHMFAIYRYAVPLEMIAPLLLAITIGLLPLRPSPRAMLTAFVLVIVAASVQSGNWYRRSVWIDRFVEAKIPPLGDTSHLMLLMAGYEPYAHVVTQFPPEVPVVRIQSNFASPNENKGINTVIRARIAAHIAGQGRFLLLVPPWQKDVAQEALTSLHLAFASESCANVTDRLFDDMELALCPVTAEGGSHVKSK